MVVCTKINLDWKGLSDTPCWSLTSLCSHFTEDSEPYRGSVGAIRDLWTNYPAAVHFLSQWEEGDDSWAASQKPTTFNCREVNILCWYVEIKCQLDATEVFIADLIACSTCFGHHYDRCPVCRMLQHPANRTHNPQLHTRPATWKTTARNTTGSNHCIMLLSFWWWA